MIRNRLLLLLFLNVFIISGLSGVTYGDSEITGYDEGQQDTLQGNQILYNGRVWRNLYYRIKEDQFLFSKDFLPGSISIDGKSYNNIIVRYDIYNDEIMTPSGRGSIVQINKEMVDSFTLIFLSKTYKFTRVQEDSLKGFNGYANVLVDGKTSLFVKYKKEIANLAVDNKYDLFFQTHRIFFVKEGVVYLVTGKREFLNLMDDYKVQIRSFIKKNRLKISKKNPDSFVPVVKFYNSLKL